MQIYGQNLTGNSPIRRLKVYPCCSCDAQYPSGTYHKKKKKIQVRLETVVAT